MNNLIFIKCKNLSDIGNINAFISEFINNYDSLQGVHLEFLEKIALYLKDYKSFISPVSYSMLKKLTQQDIKFFEGFQIPALIKDIKKSFSEGNNTEKNFKAKVGKIYFPAVATKGVIYELRVKKGNSGNSFKKTDIAVITALKKKIRESIIWDSSKFCYIISNIYKQEEHKIRGNSLTLPLALAMYSFFTNTIIPEDISASGDVRSDGRIKPVNYLQEKLIALKTERHFIKRVLVPYQEDIPENIDGIEIIRVKNIKEAFDIVFPCKADLKNLSVKINLTEDIELLKKQYNNYQIDECIINAEELIGYIEKQKHIKDGDTSLIFECYWRLGSCWCHKGDVKKTNQYLTKAERFYTVKKNKIPVHSYFQFKNNHAVSLKDLFLYTQAKKCHLDLNKEMKNLQFTDHDRGENLSSLSQLYLAQRKFNLAEKYQKSAIQLINDEDLHRNYCYLILIFIRSGDFIKAKYHLEKNLNPRFKKLDSKNRKISKGFHDLIWAEYLYRKAIDMKRRPKQLFRKLHNIALEHKEIKHFTSGLINKFSGLAHLIEKNEKQGCLQLELSLNYFDYDNSNPMMKLLGTTVRIEKAIYFLNSNKGFIAEDLVSIITDLSMEKNIKRYFIKCIKQLSCFLKQKEPNIKQIGRLLKTLVEISWRIPY